MIGTVTKWHVVRCISNVTRKISTSSYHNSIASKQKSQFHSTEFSNLFHLIKIEKNRTSTTKLNIGGKQIAKTIKEFANTVILLSRGKMAPTFSYKVAIK